MNIQSVAVVGATGAVGREMLDCLETSSLAPKRIGLFASKRGAGRELSFRGRGIVVQESTESGLSGWDLVFFAAGGEVSRRLAPVAVDGGAVVIDNSSAYRLDERVPLVIPEINPETLDAGSRIIANPNCSTIVALMAVAPLHRAFGVRRIVAATYQAVSGAGDAGLSELEAGTTAALAGRTGSTETFGRDIAFNLIPWIGEAAAGGSTDEELKMKRESRKILGDPKLEVSCTCVRVPVRRAHSIALTLFLEKPATPEAAAEILAAAPGLRLVAPGEETHGLTPVDHSGRDEVAVGRLRPAFEDVGSLALFVVGDQLRKGAALNAVQIAEHL